MKSTGPSGLSTASFATKIGFSVLGLLLVAALFVVLSPVLTDSRTEVVAPTPPGPTSPAAFSGRVVSAADIPVAEATVYLIPTAAIDMTPITAGAVYYPPYPAEAYDEPLEDAIRAKGTEFRKAVTGSNGGFSIPDLPDGTFFIHVTPDVRDREHLPGGNKSRQVYSAEQLRGTSMTIKVSSSPSPDAIFVGSTTCLACHWKFETWKQTGHKLSWTPPGAPGPMQDHSRFPDFFRSLASFKEVDDYAKGTRLELGDRDPKRKSDKFKIREVDDPRLPIETVYGYVYLWKSRDDGKYYITIVNRLNPKDPNSPSHLEMKLLYGGAVHRQRFIVAVPQNLGNRQGWYIIFQFNPDGRDDRLNRERRVWRDYKFSLWWDAGKDGKYGNGDDVIKAPPINKNTIQAMCAGCHITGHERYKDPTTGQLLVRAVNDAGGSLNIDDDPQVDEINIGCEQCHGPGSEHVAEGGYPRYIVNPKHLSSERSSVVCGRCHDRRQGVGGKVAGYTQAINKKGEMMKPGGSRHTMITEYTDPKKKGPKPHKEIWDDDIHSKKPHQQYPDFYKSKKYRNDRLLVTCTDCHDLHGGTPYRRSLIHDPDDVTSPLCQRCHTRHLLPHMEAKLGAKMKGEAITRCIDCHMPGTSIAGGDAGAYGRFINTPPYQDAKEEEENAYWEGHINSHVFDVPFKTNVGVKGVKPGKAMPIPYTNSCGVCHIVKELPYK
ncbi:MAG: hypothetical protein ACE5LL_00515 [Alphaproteobacteria bacterium]